MKIVFFLWNNFIPNFLKNFIKKQLLRGHIGKLNIDLNLINVMDILKRTIKIHKSVEGGIFNIILRGKITINEFTNINGPNTYLMADDINEINIGKFCSIASNCIFIAKNIHNYNKLSISPYSIVDELENLGGTINIGNDVWIGAGVIILPGIKIGNGAVIGAGSIVTKNVESYSIVAGNPVKFIKYRFNKELREKIEKSNWWDWDIIKIKENYNLNKF